MSHCRTKKKKTQLFVYPQSSCQVEQAGDDRCSKGNSHKPAIVLCITTEYLVSTSRWREHSQYYHRSHPIGAQMKLFASQLPTSHYSRNSPYVASSASTNQYPPWFVHDTTKYHNIDFPYKTCLREYKLRTMPSLHSNERYCNTAIQNDVSTQT